MISEGSCDIEDWSDVAKNITGIDYIFKYFKIENRYIKLFHCIFDHINAALVNKNQKKKKMFLLKTIFECLFFNAF